MGEVPSPGVVSEEYQRKFDCFAQSIGLDPKDPWVGGYVDYEWNHLRHILNSYGIDVENLNVLEFGCNFGASSILLSYLGAKVFALDVSNEYITLAKLNAGRYGVENIDFFHLEDTRVLPFNNEYFDLVCCNSVLEYVKQDHLPIVQAEIGRTVKLGGKILVTGTSNRLWPKEVHSGKWFVNYLPCFFDLAFNLNIERGVWPWKVRNGFGANYENLDYHDKGRAFVKSRSLMGGGEYKLQIYSWVMALLAVGPGFLAPNISCLLEKRGRGR